MIERQTSIKLAINNANGYGICHVSGGQSFLIIVTPASAEHIGLVYFDDIDFDTEILYCENFLEITWILSHKAVFFEIIVIL